MAEPSLLVYPVEVPSASWPDVRKKRSAVCFDDEAWRSQPRASHANTRRRQRTSPAAARENKSTTNPKVAGTRRCQTCAPGSCSCRKWALQTFRKSQRSAIIQPDAVNHVVVGVAEEQKALV